MITIEEAKELQRKMNLEIREAIKYFEASTGLHVSKIDISDRDSAVEIYLKVARQVSTEVRI